MAGAPYSTNDTIPTDELNEIFEAICNRTTGSSPDRKLKIENTDLAYGAETTIASSATIAITAANHYDITGTTDIATITADSANEGRHVFLTFANELSLLDTGNIELPGASVASGEGFQVYSNTTVELVQIDATTFKIWGSNKNLVKPAFRVTLSGVQTETDDDEHLIE